MSYKSVLIAERGGPEVIQIVEKELQPPAAGEVRVKILASPITQDDVAMRVGNRPFLAKLPFVPGYSILGVVEATGEGVTRVSPGERVVALTQFGGHAEYIYLGEEELVQVPEELDPAEAVVLILNYLVAYQVLHRVAQVEEGDKVLIIGASGGCGTAFLQLGKLAKIKMYGLASASKHEVLAEYGARPIDYRTEDFVEVIRAAEPEGIDFVFNGMADEYTRRGLAVLRRGGVLVQYGAPQSLAHFGVFLAQYLFYNLLPNGKKLKGYGTHRLGVELFAVDWQELFRLLGEGQIKPIIAKKFPFQEVVKANELMESGQVSGNVVLLSPEVYSNGRSKEQ